MGLSASLVFWLVVAGVIGLVMVVVGLVASAKCLVCSGGRTVFYPHSGERKVCPWCDGKGRR